MAKEHWKSEPDEHDYPAAVSYLSLIASPSIATELANRMKATPTATWKAKDLLRASRLSLLPPENAHVAVGLKKVDKGERLSPVLLVRGDLARQVD